MRRRPEIKPVFRELDNLKKGKLGTRGRKKALTELEKLLGKKAKKEKELAKKEENLVKGKTKKLGAFDRLSSLGKRKSGKFKGKKDPLLKIKMMALASLPLAERKNFLEKLILLRTGKLSAKERKELFEKLKTIADYYKKHKKELEQDLVGYEHPRKAIAKPKKTSIKKAKKEKKK